MGEGSLWKDILDFARFVYTGIKSDSTQDFYDSFGTHYEEFFSVQREYAADLRSILEDYLTEHNLLVATLLECGCGTGVYSAELENICDELYGIDFSQTQLEECAEKDLQIALTKGNVLSLPFPDESFDCVTSLGMLRHLPGEMMEQYFEEAYRVLKPGGVYFSEPIPQDLINISNHPMLKRFSKPYNAFMEWRGLDEHLGSADSLAEIMQDAGFTVEERTKTKEYTYDVLIARKP